MFLRVTLEIYIKIVLFNVFNGNTTFNRSVNFHCHSTQLMSATSSNLMNTNQENNKAVNINHDSNEY